MSTVVSPDSEIHCISFFWKEEVEWALLVQQQCFHFQKKNKQNLQDKILVLLIHWEFEPIITLALLPDTTALHSAEWHFAK